MNAKTAPKSASGGLRRRAEERVAAQAKAAVRKSAGDMRGLIHELEVHQVELELQNEELREARAQIEANYNALYDFAPVGYFTLGRNGDIKKANLTGASMLGQPRAQLLNRRLATFVAPDSRASFSDFLRRVALGSERESCMVTLVKGGDTPVVAYIEATASTPDAAFPVVAVDITAAEQAKRALRESEDRLRMALAASGMGVWECECDSGDIYWSLECNQILGVNFISPKLDFLARLLHPEDAGRVKSAIRHALADGKDQSVECRIIRPDGKVVWISVHGKVQFDQAGKPLRIVGIGQDITERKRVREDS